MPSADPFKATTIEILSLRTVQMKTFHLSWVAFFLCFFGWFSHAPLLPSTIAPDLGLTDAQILTAFIASVGVTIFARVGIGSLCDRIGPRRAYVYLLVFGAVAVAGSSFAWNWPSYLVSRLCIGVIGASFVITQYHTSVMFAPKVVGIANATTAGWGGLGGGVTQMVMPLVASGALAVGLADSEVTKWRAAMFVPAAAMLVVARLYWKHTTDAPAGNYEDLPALRPQSKAGESGLFAAAVRDPRVWALFLVYAGCFGMELFVNGRAAAYYQGRFGLGETSAGIIASLFGLMNLFARSLGGWLSDRFAASRGLTGRVQLLVAVMVAEGVALLVFSRMATLPSAIFAMLTFSVCVKMAQGATYSVVPFINRQSLGAVSGIVGAGGNVGAVVYAYLLLRGGTTLQDSLLHYGVAVIAIALVGLAVRFTPEDDRSAHEEQRVLEAMTGAQGSLGLASARFG